jgi:hypothetical protein
MIVRSGKCCQLFRDKELPPTYKIEALHFSETLVSICKMLHPRDHNMNIRRSENLNAYEMQFVSPDSMACILSWEADNRVHACSHIIGVLFWCVWIQSVSSHSLYLRCIWICSPLRLRRPRGLCSSVISSLIYVGISHPSHVFYMLRQSYDPLIAHMVNKEN